MDKVFIVFGSTGEYSDMTRWTVGVYSTEAAAEARATELNAYLRTHGCHTDDDDNEARLKLDLYEIAEGSDDPGCCIRYTGSDYYVMESSFHG